MESCDLLIVGAGAAGLAAAKKAAALGCTRIVLAENRAKPGGVLLQCAHAGFGAGMTGPAYVEMLLQGFPKKVQLLLGTTVVSVAADRTAVLSGSIIGLQRLCFQQLILATGCREIPAGALDIAGSRPTGVYTAGQMQERMNLWQEVPQGPVIILGSGDLGLIMAGQLAAAGVVVTALVEQKATCGGMARNRYYLEKYGIPLLCKTTVCRVCGEKQLEGVVLYHLDTGQKQMVPCKTLLVAVGYQPERQLVRGLGRPSWLQLCGNCRVVHSMIEGVIQEGNTAAIAACRKLRGEA